MLYLAMAGYGYEGSGPIGIFNTLEEAMTYAEKDCEEYGYEPYADNYWFASAWDLKQQKSVKAWNYDKEKKSWWVWNFEKHKTEPYVGNN